MDILQINITDREIEDMIEEEFKVPNILKKKIIKTFNEADIKNIITKRLEKDGMEVIQEEKEDAIITYIDDILTQETVDEYEEEERLYLSLEELNDPEYHNKVKDSLKEKESKLITSIMKKHKDDVVKIKSNLDNLLYNTGEIELECPEEYKNFFTSLFVKSKGREREVIFDFMLTAKIKQEKY